MQITGKIKFYQLRGANIKLSYRIDERLLSKLIDQPYQNNNIDISVDKKIKNATLGYKTISQMVFKNNKQIILNTSSTYKSQYKKELILTGSRYSSIDINGYHLLPDLYQSLCHLNGNFYASLKEKDNSFVHFKERRCFYFNPTFTRYLIWNENLDYNQDEAYINKYYHGYYDYPTSMFYYLDKGNKLEDNLSNIHVDYLKYFKIFF